MDSFFGRIKAALVATMPIMPSVALLFTTIFVIAPVAVAPNVLELWVKSVSGVDAVIRGVFAASGVWLVIALVYQRFIAVDTASPRNYHELCDRLTSLKAQLAVCAKQYDSEVEQAAYTEVCKYCDILADQLDQQRSDFGNVVDMRWVAAHGYVHLWNCIHRAEEALMQIAPQEVVIGQALYDEWRLSASNLDNRDVLLAKVVCARRSIDGNPSLDMGSVAKAAGAQTAFSALPPMKARAILRMVRRCLNDFRDSHWDGLVRARNRMIETGTIMGLVGYVLFVVVVVMGISPANVTAIAVLYLVGAAVGLFNRLLVDGNSEMVLNDYGLTAARMLFIPLFSGFAAVAGVVGVALLDKVLPNVGGGVAFMDLFNLEVYPLTLVLAAVFGLTPGLLVDRLKAYTRQYQADLASTSATGGKQVAQQVGHPA